MGETTTTTQAAAGSDATVTHTGFKVMYARNKDHGLTTDPKLVTRINSRHGLHEWKVGEWAPPVTGTLRACRVGYHMSPTPQQARQYVEGNIVALVEGRGDWVADTGKTAHREMRILAWWPYDIADDKLTYEMQVGRVPRSAQDAYDKAYNDATTARDTAQRAASKAFDSVIQPASEAFEQATRGALHGRDLAKKLVRIRYDEAEQIADAEYDAAVRIARTERDAAKQEAAAVRDAKLRLADRAYEEIAAPHAAARDAVVTPARTAYEAAANEASRVCELARAEAMKAHEAARAEAVAALRGPIITALGKPSAGKTTP